MDDLDSLRRDLDRVDAELIAAAAARQALVARIGAVKRDAGRQLRDFTREREVLERAARNAASAGLEPGTARAILKLLIEASLARQENDRVRAASRNGERSALVIGGAGRMGRWFARFLDAQGYAVTIADPSPCDDVFPARRDWRDGDLDADLIVVAAPLRASRAILIGLAGRAPRGVVFDLGSLKHPLIDGFDALNAAGVRVTSIHPMFGPSANVLADRHVVFVDLGNAEASATAKALFAPTLATAVDMSLNEHDRLIGWVLGLSHALNIAFASALSASTEDAAMLAAASSTTFERQLAIARDVVEENPGLYFEIQHLNPHGARGREALTRALATVIARIEAGDEAGFAALMAEGRGFLDARSTRRPENTR